MVDELLARPELGLRLLHGSAAELRRPVRWVYTTDLLDPGRYLTGGELVISGLVWRSGPGDSEAFVAALAAAGAAALLAGEAVFHGVPEDVLDACRRHGIPLLAVPEEVSFGLVTEVVVGRIGAARGDRLAHTLGRRRELLAGLAGGLSLHQLTAQVSVATGRACRVVSATGHPVAGEPLPAPDLDGVVAAALTAARFPVTSGPYSVFTAGPAFVETAFGDTGRWLTSWFVVVDGDHREWDADTDTVGELVAIAALDRARRDEGLRVGRPIAEGAIASVARGAADPAETVARLRQAGLAVDSTAVGSTAVDSTAADSTAAGPAGAGTGLTVVVAAFVDRPDLTPLAHDVLTDAAAHAGPTVVGTHDDLAVALLAGGPAAVVDALRRLTPGLGRLRLAVGVSRPSAVSTLSGALREAAHARDLARTRGGPVEVVTGAEVTSHVALLAGIPDEVRRAFAASVLEPVLAYDARTDAGLLETLAAFLDCGGSWSRTAARLHLHVNTVRYRIGRVQDLTGRDLATTAHRVDLFLALRSR